MKVFIEIAIFSSFDLYTDKASQMRLLKKFCLLYIDLQLYFCLSKLLNSTEALNKISEVNFFILRIKFFL